MKYLTRNPEFRVVGVVLLSLLAGEAGMRLVEARLSKDVEHLSHFGELPSEFSTSATESAPLRVLFLGNSLTRYGVSVDDFRDEAQATIGQPISIAKMTPDNTALADWFYAYRNYFAETGQAPDLLVIGFQGGHLRDAPSIHPQRLAHFYCDPGDWPDLCRDDLRDFESQAAFIVASQSALVANRDRIERRLLDLAIPGYQDGIQELNERVQSGRTGTSPEPTYERLGRLLDIAEADGTRVILAAMPVPTPYDIDQELRDLTVNRGITLLDCRNIEGISDEMFPDGLHMNPEAASHYSRHLARMLDRNPPRRQVVHAELSEMSRSVP